MHKSATKYNETIGKCCKNKHGASKIIDTLATYQGSAPRNENGQSMQSNLTKNIQGFESRRTTSDEQV
jgi:hypothetical protein